MSLLENISAPAHQNLCVRTLEQTLETLAPLYPRRVTSTPEFADRERLLGRNRILLFYRSFELKNRGELRFTGITGPGTDIFAVMIFPGNTQHVPIFASEYVVMGGNVRAAVVDWQDGGLCAEARAEQNDRLRTLSEHHLPLMYRGEKPAWCEDYFTPHAVFVMRAEGADLPRLEEAYRDYLEGWTRIAESAKSASCTSEPTTLRLYKDHHVVHTPGRTYLSRVFGDEWTEAFLSSAMYA